MKSFKLLFKAFFVALLFLNHKVKIRLISYEGILRLLFLVVLLALFLSCNSKPNKVNRTSTTESDSTAIWIQQSKNKKFTTEERKEYLLKAYLNPNIQKNDSIKISVLSKIAYEAYNLRADKFFRKVNLETQKLSIKLRDTFSIADTHWNYGLFYAKNEILDSAYFHYSKAYEYYEAISNENFAGNMLYNMAIIQKDVKDYTGSEVVTFQAISKYKKLKKHLNLYLCYNLLGIIFNEIKEFDNAISYYTIALEYLEKVANKKIFKETCYNNLGLMYQRKGDYPRAIEYFNMALNNETLLFENPDLYSKLIDNRAYTNFLKGDSTNLLQDFNTALRIRDSINHFSGIVYSKLHLAEYYMDIKDSVNAYLNVKEGYELATNINNNNAILKTLMLLSKLDKKNSIEYLNKHIYLSDSLKSVERKTRNKFTRIRFETDEFIEETEKLSKEKIVITVASFIVLFILSLLYFIRIQRAKNKELLLESEQQRSNEEIYELMLKQQTKLNEGRLTERHRISEDLHDGVLGKIFGTRMGLGFLKISGDAKTLDKHRFFIDELQQIEKEIRTISHELKNEIIASKQNYIAILKDLIIKQSDISGFQYSITCVDDIDWNEIDDKIKINCYRMIQEGLQNINKYAKASFVHVDFNLKDKMLKLTVKDNGVGFNIRKKNKGIGLKNFKSRTKKLGGEFVISSRINDGTKLTFLIPV